MRSLITKLLLSGAVCSWAAFAQYAAALAGPPPSEVAPAISAALQKNGVKISNGATPYCEVWFRTTMPQGPKTTEENVTFTNLTPGTLLGVIRFDGKGADRRGQVIKPGVYTLRYGLMPINGDHQGAAPQRDFLLMTPAASDTDLNATPAFAQLVTMSKKASGTPHPAVISFWKEEAGDFKAGFDKQGDTDWVLQTKIGTTPVAVILVGTASS